MQGRSRTIDQRIQCLRRRPTPRLPRNSTAPVRFVLVSYHLVKKFCSPPGCLPVITWRGYFDERVWSPPMRVETFFSVCGGCLVLLTVVSRKDRKGGFGLRV